MCDNPSAAPDLRDMVATLADEAEAANSKIEWLETQRKIDPIGLLWAEAVNRAENAETEIARLTAEVERLTKGSICEVAATNPSVMEYMSHWEGRAEKAETERDEWKDEYKIASRLLNLYRDAAFNRQIERDLALAQVAAAYEAAADACNDYPVAAPSEDEWTRYDLQIQYSQASIRALTPANAQAALEKMLDEARLEGWRAGRDEVVEWLIASGVAGDHDSDPLVSSIREMSEPKENSHD